MVDDFVKAGEGLFTSPPPASVLREKGTYVYLYAKLSKRLSSTLAVDREVLVLFTSFEEQQQRTIKTASDLIGASSGRLESSIVVIIHADAEGNAKLKRWGRNVGLSVLPVYAGSCPSKPEEIERLLGQELFSHDPFDVTGPVSDDENFFGRRNEAHDLARKLQTGQIRSILGIRKIGKTSVINRIVADAKANYDCYCIMLDCSRDDIWTLSAEQLISALIEALRSAKGSPSRYAVVEPTTNEITTAEASKQFLNAIKGSDKPVVFFVDEVDYITPGSPTTVHWRHHFNPFWRQVRAVYQEACRDSKPFSMLISGVSSKWFSVESIDGVENSALALIPEEYLSPLPRGASCAMIRKMARSAGLVFSDEVANIIASACCDMPYWIRKACSYIHRQIEISARPVAVTTSQATLHVNSFIDTEGDTIAQVAISHLFRVYPELESPYLALLKGGNAAANVSKKFVHVLDNYGVLSNKESGNMRNMIKAGIELRVGQATTETTTHAEDPGGMSAQTFDRWADDLAVINKARNVLERQLRQIVINFLRADVIADKTKGSMRSRLAKVLPPGRQFDNLSADELIEKFLWLELVALVKREWRLFEGLFGDRNQFELQSSVINDRPDAHAKDLDAADFALYRRSLKWMNDRINSV
ncbi:MAG: ATP-binding protein [Candidatus Sulfotelmatobacter sp.]